MAKSNLLGPELRGRGVREWYNANTGLYREYYQRAIAAAPPGSALRRELLLEQAAMFPGKGRRNSGARLRRCLCCPRAYQVGPNSRKGNPLTKFCPACRRIALMTPSQLHRKALLAPRSFWRRMNRIRREIGDPVAGKPAHCQHGHCTNWKRLRQWWGVVTGGAQVKWLCPRHFWIASSKHPPALRPRKAGRPPSGKRSSRGTRSRAGF